MNFKRLLLIFLSIYLLQNIGNQYFGIYSEIYYWDNPTGEISKGRLAGKDINLEINWSNQQNKFWKGSDKIIVDAEIVNRNDWRLWTPFFKIFQPKAIGKCYIGNRTVFLGEFELSFSIEAVGIYPRPLVLSETRKLFNKKIQNFIYEASLPIENMIEKTSFNFSSGDIFNGKRGININMYWGAFNGDLSFKTNPPSVVFPLKKTLLPVIDTIYFTNHFSDESSQIDSLTAYLIVNQNLEDSLLKFAYYYPNHQKELEGYYKDTDGFASKEMAFGASALTTLDTYGIWRRWAPDGALRAEEFHLEEEFIFQKNWISYQTIYYRNGLPKWDKRFIHEDTLSIRLDRLWSKEKKILRECEYQWRMEKDYHYEHCSDYAKQTVIENAIWDKT